MLNAYDSLASTKTISNVNIALLQLGLEPTDALALATNLVNLFYQLNDKRFTNPLDLLNNFTLEEITKLCQQSSTDSEWGYNLNFKGETDEH